MEPDSSVRETYRNVLAYAVAMAGNDVLLAERLGVNVLQLRNWISGIERIPVEIFLKTVDVVIAATPEEIRRSARRRVEGDGAP